MECNWNGMVIDLDLLNAYATKVYAGDYIGFGTNLEVR